MDLFGAVNCGSSWLPLTDSCDFSLDDVTPRINLLASKKFPLDITEKQFEQLARVYEACISPSQILPILVTKENRYVK